MGWVEAELGLGVVEMGLNDMAASLQKFTSAGLRAWWAALAGATGGVY
jgi:hypothetical protein